MEGKIKEAAICLLKEQADLNFKGTDPGIVFFKNPQIPEEVKDFARNAITGIVTLKEATNLIKKFESEALGYNTCTGIRGEKPGIVRKAFAFVKPLEPVERWVIFRTNQGTDAHFTKVPALSETKPSSSVVAKAVGSRKPIPIPH